MANVSGKIKRNEFNDKEDSYFRKVLISVKRHKFLYLLMIPGLLYFILFHFVPVYFLSAAFKDFNVFVGLKESPWVGFENFRNLFKTKYFVTSLRNTLILSSMYKTIGFVIPIILALLLNELKKMYFKRTVQTLIYIPHFISWVIVGGVWITILSPSTGIVNFIIRSLGFEPVFFMADQGWFRWILLFSNIWKNAGWRTIVYLAAIAGINPEMYESAIIDGAGRFKQVMKITLPCMLPAIVAVFILGLDSVLKIFHQVFVMYNPAVAEVSETIDTYVYKIGIQNGNISFATAVGIFSNSISLILILVTNKLVKTIQGYSIL